MTIQLEHGEDYKAVNGERWEVWDNGRETGVPDFYGYRTSDGAGCRFLTDGRFRPDSRGRDSRDTQFDLVAKWTDVSEPCDPDSKIDLATAHPIDADTLGLALVVGGQTKTFTISRSSAASLAGRIAEALVK